MEITRDASVQVPVDLLQRIRKETTQYLWDMKKLLVEDPVVVPGPSPGEPPIEVPQKAFVNSMMDNFQRKIDMHRTEALWSVVTAAADPDDSSPPRPPKADVWVCASLVEKMSNLGGLARTSEIFNVQGLTVGSRKISSSSDFGKLSVNANKWVDIRVVEPENVARWLNEKKNEGYTIVGLEQTARSIPLQHIRFPGRNAPRQPQNTCF